MFHSEYSLIRMFTRLEHAIQEAERSPHPYSADRRALPAVRDRLHEILRGLSGDDFAAAIDGEGNHPTEDEIEAYRREQQRNAEDFLGTLTPTCTFCGHALESAQPVFEFHFTGGLGLMIAHVKCCDYLMRYMRSEIAAGLDLEKQIGALSYPGGWTRIRSTRGDGQADLDAIRTRM